MIKKTNHAIWHFNKKAGKKRDKIWPKLKFSRFAHEKYIQKNEINDNESQTTKWTQDLRQLQKNFVSFSSVNPNPQPPRHRARAITW